MDGNTKSKSTSRNWFVRKGKKWHVLLSVLQHTAGQTRYKGRSVFLSHSLPLLSRRGKKTPCQRALLNTAETVMLRDESRTHCSLFLLLFMCLSLFCDVCDMRDWKNPKMQVSRPVIKRERVGHFTLLCVLGFCFVFFLIRHKGCALTEPPSWESYF